MLFRSMGSRYLMTWADLSDFEILVGVFLLGRAGNEVAGSRSSINMGSTFATMAKWWPRCTHWRGRISCFAENVRSRTRLFGAVGDVPPGVAARRCLVV